MKNSDFEKYKSIVEDNVNVGKTNDGTEFFILVAGVIGILFIIYLFADSLSCFVIDRLPDKTITQIETSIPKLNYESDAKDNKNQAQIERLEKIKQKIIAKDKTLQNKSSFPISIEPMKEVNAFIELDGSIHFTEGFLKKFDDEEIIAFVMAHELGHYAHRDCLKHVSRQVIAGLITSIISNGQSGANVTVNQISELNALTYSRSQEKRADEYANKMLYKLYGRNTAAIKFFQLLEKEEGTSEFLQYFSTHPSTKNRLRLAKSIRSSR